MIKTLIICAILVLLIFIIYQIYEQTHFVVKSYTISSDKLKNLKEDAKIVFITDLHNKIYGKDNETLINKIDEISPDIILIGGDLVIAKSRKSCDIAYSLMKKLSAKYPCFYANGNHEYRMKIYEEDYGDTYDKYIEQLKDMGVHYLENESENIEIHGQKICIYGLEIDKKYYKRFTKIYLEEEYVKECLGEASKNYNIVLAHNPKYFDNYADWGADLTVSGHIHGGLVRIPFIGGVASPQIELFPKYSGGKYNIGNKVMVLSCGLGTHTINVRVNNPAELSVITLKGDK